MFRFRSLAPSAPPAPPDPQYPKDWCVLALLFAAALADNDIAREEEIEIDALAIRARSLIRMPQEAIDSCIAECRQMVANRNNVFALVEHACRKLPVEEGLPEAVFAHCVDIVLADRKLVHDEREFLTEMASALRLSEAVTAEIITVLSWKNRY